MKKQLVKALTKIGLLSVMGMVIAAGSAQGQSLADKIRANIPFDFMVGDKKLPAGEYSIGRARQESSDTWLLIRSVDGRSYVIRLTSRVEAQEPKDKGTLVFHSYGDQYFLYQVWPAGGSTGRVLFKSHGVSELLER
ncbi:MAG: hypothetical protein ACREBC_31490 [Pyrinomonadaceae bacterium]